MIDRVSIVGILLVLVTGPVSSKLNKPTKDQVMPGHKNMLKGKKVNEYTKKFKDGAVGYVNVYAVTGSAEEMEEFKASQGENLRVDEKTGEILFFSANASGDQVIDININPRSGQAKENDAFRQAVTKEFVRAKSLGADVLQATAQEYAKHTVAQLFASRRTASAGSIVTETPVKAVELAKTPAGKVDELED